MIDTLSAGSIDYMNRHKKYLKEVVVFVVLLVGVICLFMFVSNAQSKGIRKYCENNPSECMPAIYPGKVVEK